MQYSYSPYSPSPSDASEAVRDSIHLDWTPAMSGCPECGVRVKLWDGFAHRTIWNRSADDSYRAFQIHSVSIIRDGL